MNISEQSLSSCRAWEGSVVVAALGAPNNWSLKGRFPVHCVCDLCDGRRPSHWPPGLQRILQDHLLFFRFITFGFYQLSRVSSPRRGTWGGTKGITATSKKKKSGRLCFAFFLLALLDVTDRFCKLLMLNFLGGCCPCVIIFTGKKGCVRTEKH